MKILMAHSNFSQQNILKQPWKVTYELSKHLAKRGHEVVILTDVIDKVEFRDILVEVKCVNYGHLRSKIKLIKPLIKDFDILLYFGNSLSGIYLKGLRGIHLPLVLYISSAHYSFSELRCLSLKELASHSLHLCFSLPPLSYVVRLLNKDPITVIVVPNNFLKERLVEYGVDEHKILVFPTGFNIKEYLESESNFVDIREKLGFSPEEFIITYLGSPLTIRGTDTLIKATYLLNKWFKGFRVLLLLRVDSKEEVKEEIFLRSLIKKSNLLNKFFVTSGILSHERIKEYIYASDVIALPFKIVQSEPPLSILESMVLSKPVVTTKTCGLPELIGNDKGVLVEPNNPKDLALAIYQLYHDPEKRSEIGEKAREFMLKQPDWASVTGLYERFFQKLVNMRKYYTCV
jgi:glycosyltransferase involved in cell wall biosynthesis